MLGLFFLLAASTTAAQPITPAERAAIRSKMTDLLRDEESARYKWPLKHHAAAYCFWVNATNGYGGYTGYRAMSAIVISGLRKSPSVVVLPIDADSAARKCAEDGYKMP